MKDSDLRRLGVVVLVVAVTVLGLRALERYSARPLIYIEGVYPIYIESGWSFEVRYSVDGVPCAMYAPSKARAKRFTAYLCRVGRVINDAPKVKDVKGAQGALPALDKNP